MAALLVLCGSPAEAQSTYTWSGATNSTWNTTSSNWTGGTGYWTGTSNAVFGSAGAGTVTVSGSQAVTGILFTGTGFTLSNTGTLWLASATTSITANQNATILSVVSGANALLVDGSATLVLGNNYNNYSGGTTISSSSTLQVGFGNLNGILPSTGSVTNNGSLVLNRSGTLTVGNAISGNGSVSLIGPGTSVLSGSNTYTGTTTVTRSTLQIGAGSTAGSISSSSALVLGGASLIMSRSGTVTQAFNGTTLNAGASVASSTNASITVNFGAITRNVGATLDLSTTGTFITSSANANGILGGWATVGGANWAVANGNSAITALSSYTNDTWASGNNTTITASGNVAASATTNSLRFNTAGANTLTLSGSATVASGGILVTPTVSNNASTITGGTLLGSSGGDLIVVQSNTAAPLTISSVIADNGSATGLTKSGAGTLVLGSNNTYTGTTAINGGTLQIGDGGATGAISLSSAITGGAAGGGGTLVFNRSNTVTQGTDFNTVIGGAINVSQLGSGTLVLGSNNTYTGTTSILGGVVQISSATNSLGNGSTGAVILNGGTLSPTWSGTQTQSWSFAIGSGGGTLLLAANQRLGGASQVSGSGTFTIQGQASSSGLYQVGGMNKNFSGFSGKVVINNAAVLYANNLLAATGTGADAVTLNNAYLTNLGSSSGANVGSSTLGIWLGTGTSLIAAQYSTTVFSALSGTATNSAVYFIPQNGSSAFLTLSNTANSYSADTYLGNYLNVNYSTGTFGGLRLGASNVLPNGVNKGNVYLYTGANPSAFVNAHPTYFTTSNSSILDLNGYSETINGLSSLNATTGTYSTNVFVDNMLASSTSALMLGDGDATATFAGSIRNSGVGAILNLTKIGSGTQTLSGSNSYAGTTGINAGTLLFTSTAALYSGSTASWTATNLTTGSGATAAFGVSGSSGFTSGNLDTLFGLGTGSTGFLPGSSFGIDTTGTTFTYASNIANPNSGANALGLVKLGSGTLTLSGSNTFSGGATVALGRLVVGSSNALGTGTAAVSGGVLDVGANAPSVAGFTITSGSLVGTTGTLTATTYALQGGSVSANLGMGTVNVTVGTTTLSGTASASAINISSGSLALGGSGLLSSNATVTVNGGVLDTTPSSYTATVGAFNMSSGSLVGTGTITASTYGLQGGTLNAVLGSGAITVSTGTTTLGSASRFNSGSVLTVSSGQLTLGGNETVASYSQSGGILGGVGKTLTSGTYALNGGTVNVNLGGGSITATSGTTTLSGSADATSITINGGSLILAASNRFASTGTVSIQSGSLDTGSGYSNSFNSFTLSGGSLLGSGTVTSTSGYALQGGALNAVLGSGAITVSTGTTTLGSGGRFNSASALTVQSGQLTLSGSESVASFVLSGGVLDGNGKSLTSAADYDVRSGSVLANLGGSVGLVKSTGGTVTLSGANTYSGATTIQSGTLVVGGANAIPGGSAITIGSSNSRGFLEVDHPLSISSLTFTGSGGDISDQSASTVTLWAASGTATINVSSGSNYFHANATLSSPTVVDVANGAFFGFHNNLYGNGSASLTKSGSGTMELAGDNDQLQGNLFITGGRVNVGTGMNQIGTGTTTLSGWATIDLGGQSFTDRIVVINGTILNAGGTATTTTIAGISTIGGTTAQGTYDITSSGSALFNVAVGSGSSTVNVNVNSSGAGGGQASFALAVGARGNIVVYAGGTAAFGSTVEGAVTSHGASTFNGNLLSGANAGVRSGGSSTFNASTAAGSTVSVDAGGAATFAGEVAGQATINGSATFSTASGLTGLLYTGTTGSALLDNVAAAITGEIHNDGTLTVNRTSGSQTISGYLHGSGSLVKQGAGTLVLSGSSTFTGVTTISAGVVSINGASALQSTSGVNIANGAGLTYTGGAGSLDRDITVTGGVGTVTNSGAGKLTLAGTLTKNGTVLQLSGGAFNVTGQIVGTSANSDLYVNGASVTLSNTNSYNGPTYVFNSGTLALGVNSAIPNNSTVTLGASGTGSATGPGTLDLGTFTNTVAGLVFSGSGNTLKMAANQTAAPQLATNSSMSLGAGTTLDLTGMGTSAGLYKLVSYTSRTGTFGTVSGMAAGYQLVYGTTELDAQQKAVLGTVMVTNPAVSIITGGSAAFTYTVANGAASGGTSLVFTGSGNANVAGSSNGSATAGSSSSSVAGLYFTGTGVGSGQTGTFNVNAPDAYGISTATGTVSVTVLDHATSSLSSASTPLTAMTISLGQWNYATQMWESGTSAGAFSIYNLASQYGANLTADLSLLSVTGSGNGFSTNLLDTLATIAGGTSSQFSIFFDPTGLSASGTQSTTFAISTSDKTGMSGATASNTLYVTASVIVVPEPDTIIFAGIGIAMAGWSLWKRRRIAQILLRPAP